MEYKLQSESRDVDPVRRKVARHRGLHYLRRYFALVVRVSHRAALMPLLHLVAPRCAHSAAATHRAMPQLFGAHLLECDPALPLPSYVEWLGKRPELTHLWESIGFA